MKQKANKGKAAKKAKKKAKLASASSADAALPAAVSPVAISCADAGTSEAQFLAGDSQEQDASTAECSWAVQVQHHRLPQAAAAAEELAGADAQSEQLDLAALSLVERDSHGLHQSQPAADQWEVQTYSRRAASRKAVPQLPLRTLTVLEVRKADMRRPPAAVTAAEKPQRQTPEAVKLLSPASPQLQQPPPGPQVQGRWAAVVAGKPLPQPPSTPPPQERPPAQSATTAGLPATSGVQTPPPLPHPQHASLQAAPLTEVPHMFQTWAALQSAAAEPAADVSRTSSYSLWGGGMSDLSRASLPLSSSRDSLSAISDGSLYGSPPMLGSQQLGAGLAALHGSSCQRSKPLALSPLFTGKAGAGIWSAFSLGPAASPFGGSFSVGPMPSHCDPSHAVAAAAPATADGDQGSQQLPFRRPQMLL